MSGSAAGSCSEGSSAASASFASRSRTSALAAVIWGLAIAFGDPYDIGRAGLLLISLIFTAPGAVLLVSGLLLIRSRAKPREC